MSNIYSGLLFLHGHIVHPEYFADTPESSARDDAKTATTTRAAERSTAVAGRGVADHTCIAC